MIRIGEKLPNGAMLIAASLKSDGSYAVLAVWGLSYANGVEYVTWISDDDGNTFRGRYFGQKLGLAVENFLRRAAE